MLHVAGSACTCAAISADVWTSYVRCFRLQISLSSFSFGDTASCLEIEFGVDGITRLQAYVWVNHPACIFLAEDMVDAFTRIGYSIRWSIAARKEATEGARYHHKAPTMQ